ncbi:hypothetical protein KL918_002870 [Ogataea parapolymorpha]|uniref:Uncharacterized protein n=1 Tax=Ogataea parapolymorpha (strain ATCC 26012 / BCRC 20466 / JCM 22074 / NRRL Y-7560 / DL-1) TaxID=871575 RepID=W1QHW0_OGAPD|nr:hypothetical protein HPODL_00629 [Ogataea parapolymorpha DL-1]ESX01231.1 hypothetical protein HPODL_00629 [Ogataea parapolymorpha DL-1]KAG7867431.1 hypothetical protein KL918_002870 [Ogataea parapolymorpha]KAG7871817.1 hypothetical protein KL916_003667 [Ogataea parapolymorpha]
MTSEFEHNAAKVVALRNRALIQAATSKDAATRRNYERLLLERRLASDVKEKEIDTEHRSVGRLDLVELRADELCMLQNLGAAFRINSPPRKLKRTSQAPTAAATQAPTQLPQATSQGYLPPPPQPDVPSAKRVHRFTPEFTPKLDY